MSGSSSKPTNSESNDGSKERTEWELRPGGMVVQKRDDGVSAAVPMIKINVSHGSSQHEITVPAQSTFGELKRVLAQETGLEPQEQRLLFRGKEKENDEWLHAAGVKDMSKVVLLEEPASKEKKLEQMKRDEGISMACEAVARVRAEVDKLAEKISSLESAVHGGTKVEEKEFAALTELLMLQLLKLDGIEAEGEAKAQRKIEAVKPGDTIFIGQYLFTGSETTFVWLEVVELKGDDVVCAIKNTATLAGSLFTLHISQVRIDLPTLSEADKDVRRVQNLVEMLDSLKARNSNPFSNSSNAVKVTTQWEAFESGMGSLNPPRPLPSSTKITNDWELFD